MFTSFPPSDTWNSHLVKNLFGAIRMNEYRKNWPIVLAALRELWKTGKVSELKSPFYELVRPGRDPRTDTPLPILRSDVLKAKDLVTGMQLKGTVRNVVDFGAFIDIGVKQDGLLHRTQIPSGTGLKVGDIIDVEILKIDQERGRIDLGWVN
jgi:transcriptional accessory protein Tex/SPT6